MNRINQMPKFSWRNIKNAYYLYRFKHRILQELSQRELILVHQMGKVGSSTIYKSLKHLNLSIPIYHTHILDPKILEDLKRDINLHPHLNQRQRIITELCLHEQIKKGLDQKKWKIITLVRDPISKNISSFFENLSNPFFYRNGTIENQDLDELIQQFLDNFHHQWVLNWFDRNIKNIFNIDVFSQEFPKDQGYKIFTRENVEVLLIRTEDIDSKIEEAMKKFMNLEDFNLINANIAKKKKYAKKYKKFQQIINLPESYIDEMYNSKYAQHFYSEEEIERLKAKWLKKV
ncbi:MAG: putative capsular polysaccharide synthesis family protein [Crocosphaera sp.]|nr:putative capsular polysaccharide synthesis family protein [Crocosphaera sp.]